MEIEFQDVSFTYQEHSPLEQKALKQITTKLKINKINAIIGPSGSGKTTFIELINALIIPTKGNIKVGSFNIEKNKKIKKINDLRFDVGLVFQYPEEQFFQPTVKKEIAFGMKYFKYKLDNIDKRINDALKMVGLDETFLDRNPFELSSGEMRKVAIASILAFNPKVIIFDEPTVSLDNRSKKELLRLLIRLKDKYNKTIIIVSHDMDMLYQITDNYIVLNDGFLLIDGDRETVFKDLKLLRINKIVIPRVVEFIEKAKVKRGIKLSNEDNIRDLIKTVFRNV